MQHVGASAGELQRAQGRGMPQYAGRRTEQRPLSVVECFELDNLTSVCVLVSWRNNSFSLLC